MITASVTLGDRARAKVEARQAEQNSERQKQIEQYLREEQDARMRLVEIALANMETAVDAAADRGERSIALSHVNGIAFRDDVYRGRNGAYVLQHQLQCCHIKRFWDEAIKKGLRPWVHTDDYEGVHPLCPDRLLWKTLLTIGVEW